MNDQISVKSNTPDTRNLFFGILFILFFFWDFYSRTLEIRVLDILGIFLAFSFTGYQLLKSRNLNGFLRKFNRAEVAIVTLLVISLLIRIDIASIKTIIGILLGISVFYIYKNITISVLIIKILLLVHLGAFFLQFFVFQIFGSVINFHFMSDLAMRIYHKDLNILRVSGLFQEPNSYSWASFMLLILIMRMQLRFIVVKVLLVVSILISQSLWGIIACVFYLGYEGFRKQKALTGVFVLVVTMFLLLEFTHTTNMLGDFTKNRIVNVKSDESIRLRYLVLFDYLAETDKKHLVFGQGFNMFRASKLSGANGVSFVIYSVGFIGFFVLLIFMLVKGKNYYRLMPFILLSISSYPMFTYFFWWAWLAIMLNHNDRAVEPVISASSTVKNNAERGLFHVLKKS